MLCFIWRSLTCEFKSYIHSLFAQFLVTTLKSASVERSCRLDTKILSWNCLEGSVKLRGAGDIGENSLYIHLYMWHLSSRIVIWSVVCYQNIDYGDFKARITLRGNTLCQCRCLQVQIIKRVFVVKAVGKTILWRHEASHDLRCTVKVSVSSIPTKWSSLWGSVRSTHLFVIHNPIFGSAVFISHKGDPHLQLAVCVRMCVCVYLWLRLPSGQISTWWPFHLSQLVQSGGKAIRKQLIFHSVGEVRVQVSCVKKIKSKSWG